MRYTLVFIDSVSLTRVQRFESNNSGAEPMLTMIKQQIQNVVYSMSGSNNTRIYNLVWFVEATDGLYTTQSSPPNKDPNNNPGFHLTFDTPVSAPSVAIPARLVLGQNYPNPFNPSTSIAFSVPTNGRVSLRLYDLLGTQVATVLDEVREAGEYSINFNASALPSGTYMYKLQADGKTLTRLMTLMK